MFAKETAYYCLGSEQCVTLVMAVMAATLRIMATIVVSLPHNLTQGRLSWTDLFVHMLLLGRGVSRSNRALTRHDLLGVKPAEILWFSSIFQKLRLPKVFDAQTANCINPFAVAVIRVKTWDLFYGISHTENLLDHLVTEGPMTDAKGSVVLTIRTCTDQKWRVLDILETRGEKACRKFFHHV